MANPDKNKQVMDQLASIITKSASTKVAEDAKVTGPEQVKAESAPAAPVVQNNVTPEKVEQKKEQTPSTDVNVPAKETKEASATLKDMATQLLAEIQKQANASLTPVTPLPAVSQAPVHVNQNELKPEAVVQKVEQKPSTDKNKPLSKTKSAEELEREANVDKTASYLLGKQFAEAIAQQALNEKVAMAKEAGRRDFEIMISKAAKALEASKPAEKQASQDMSKQAEDAGAAEFQRLYKQAQDELVQTKQASQIDQVKQYVAGIQKQAAEQINTLKAQLAEKEAAIKAAALEQKENEKIAAMCNAITQAVTQNVIPQVTANVLSGLESRLARG